MIHHYENDYGRELHSHCREKREELQEEIRRLRELLKRICEATPLTYEFDDAIDEARATLEEK